MTAVLPTPEGAATDAARRVALAELLARPDPPELRRAHRLTQAGDPLRFARWQPVLSVIRWRVHRDIEGEDHASAAIGPPRLAAAVLPRLDETDFARCLDLQEKAARARLRGDYTTASQLYLAAARHALTPEGAQVLRSHAITAALQRATGLMTV